MLSDDTQSASTAVNRDLRVPREVEFAQALDRYMVSYTAEQRRRLVRSTLTGMFPRLINVAGTRDISRKRAHSPSAVRDFGAVTTEALEGHSNATSRGGKFLPVGVMCWFCQ